MYKLKVFIFAILPVILVLGLIPAIALFKDVADARDTAERTTFKVEPAIFEYKVSGVKRFDIELTNLSSQTAIFDMGDGSMITVAGGESVKHSYNVLLDGSTTRFHIQRLNPVGSTQLANFCEGIIVRIEPRSK